MTRIATTLATLLLALAGALALAQNTSVDISADTPPDDPLLARYSSALTNIRASMAALPETSSDSLAALERAENDFRGLLREASAVSDTLAGGVTATFDQARTAISRQSSADLAVQATVIAGGLRRVVYESALREASQGNLALAQARVNRLGEDIGLSAERQTSLGAGVTATELQARFEDAVAQNIVSRLTVVQAQLQAGVTDRAYRALAQAYSDFIPVQDSVRVDSTMSDTFVRAITALVGDEQTLTGELEALLTQTTALVQAARATFAPDESETEGAVLEASTEANTEASVNLAAVTPTVTAVDLNALVATPELSTRPDGAAEVATAALGTGILDITTLDTTTLVEATNVAPEGVPQGEDVTDAQTDAAVTTAPVADTRTAALVNELAAYTLTPNVVRRLLEDYERAGLASSQAAVERLYGTTGRLVAALETGDASVARAQLTRFSEDYGRFLSPLVSARDALLDRTTSRLAAHLVGVNVLSLQDAAVLSAQLANVAALLTGTTGDALQPFSAGTTLVWSGLPRMIVVLALMVLAFVPLWLLNLAFGGGNRNWQWIGLSLLLLLVPVVFEGISSLGVFAAQLTGVTQLGWLARVSMFQSPLGQVGWALLTALAIAFASLGLYGICVQFGLLGNPASSAGSSTGSSAGVSTVTPETRTRLTGTGANTVVDWDDEF